MLNNIIVIDGNYHLGDNFGVFQSATYIGLKLSLPLKQTWVNLDTKNVSFVFLTSDVETWGEWKGHKVSINGTEIGRLKDPNNEHGNSEEFVINLPLNEYLSLLDNKENFVLEVELDRQEAMPGFSDDFKLNRIATREIAITIG